MTDRTLELRARESVSRCAYCHDALVAEPWSCPSCQVLLHDDCRRLARRCPTIGCSAPPDTRPVADAIAALSRELLLRLTARAAIFAVALAGVVGTYVAHLVAIGHPDEFVCLGSIPAAVMLGSFYYLARGLHERVRYLEIARTQEPWLGFLTVERGWDAELQREHLLGRVVGADARARDVLELDFAIVGDVAAALRVRHAIGHARRVHVRHEAGSHEAVVELDDGRLCPARVIEIAS